MGLPDGSLHTTQMIRQQVLICMKEMRAVHSYKTIGTDLTTLRRKPAVRAIDHLCVHSGEVPFLSFPLLDEQDWLMNCFSTRLGGVSEEGLAALNLSYTREKGGREKVDENFRRMAESAGFPAEDMVLSWQTHTTNIRVVREEDRGKGFTSQRDYCDIDGLVTDVPGLVLVTFYGDCVPLLAADPVRHVIGAAHSGWKGTLNNVMYVNHPFWTVDTMFYTIGKAAHVIKYAHLFLLTQDLASMNAGSAVPSMTTDILNRLPVLIPTLEALKTFDTIVSTVYSVIRSDQVENASLASTRDSILPQLLSGAIDINSLIC